MFALLLCLKTSQTVILFLEKARARKKAEKSNQKKNPQQSLSFLLNHEEHTQVGVVLADEGEEALSVNDALCGGGDLCGHLFCFQLSDDGVDFFDGQVGLQCNFAK